MQLIRLLLAVFLLSCEHQPPTDPKKPCEESYEDRGEAMYVSLPILEAIEFIIDDLDWFDLADGTENQKCNAKSIAIFYNINKGARCTAFKVGSRNIMTNNHCVSSQEDAESVVVSFNYDVGQEPVWHECTKLLQTNASLDYSLLECSETMSEIPYISLKTIPKSEEVEDVYLLHQNCNYYDDRGCKPYKKISEGELLSTSGSRIFHSSDSLGGTSGSPIFDKATHQIIGLHNSGYYHPTKQPPFGAYNAGYLMENIVKDLESKGQQIE